MSDFGIKQKQFHKARAALMLDSLIKALKTGEVKAEDLKQLPELEKILKEK